MPKTSALDKLIHELEAEITDHEREIQGKQKLIARLRRSQLKPTTRRPRAVSKPDTGVPA